MHLGAACYRKSLLAPCHNCLMRREPDVQLGDRRRKRPVGCYHRPAVFQLTSSANNKRRCRRTTGYDLASKIAPRTGWEVGIWQGRAGELALKPCRILKAIPSARDKAIGGRTAGEK